MGKGHQDIILDVLLLTLCVLGGFHGPNSWRVSEGYEGMLRTMTGQGWVQGEAVKMLSFSLALWKKENPRWSGWWLWSRNPVGLSSGLQEKRHTGAPVSKRQPQRGCSSRTLETCCIPGALILIQSRSSSCLSWTIAGASLLVSVPSISASFQVSSPLEPPKLSFPHCVYRYIKSIIIYRFIYAYIHILFFVIILLKGD